MKDLLIELDSAAIRCAAAGVALERAEDHPDKEAAKQIKEDSPAIRARLRVITGDIMDMWSLVRAFEIRRANGKTEAA